MLHQAHELKGSVVEEASQNSKICLHLSLDIRFWRTFRGSLSARFLKNHFPEGFFLVRFCQTGSKGWATFGSFTSPQWPWPSGLR